MWSLNNFIALSGSILFSLFVIFALPTEARQTSKDAVSKTEKPKLRNDPLASPHNSHNCEMGENLYDARRIAAFEECSLIFKPLVDSKKEEGRNLTINLQDIAKHVKSSQNRNQNQNQNQSSMIHSDSKSKSNHSMEFNMTNIDETLNNFVEDLTKTILSTANSSQLQQLMSGGIRIPRIFPCMMACMIHKLKLVDETGKTNETAIVEHFTSISSNSNSTLTPEMTKNIIGKCYERTHFNGTHVGKNREEKINLNFSVPVFSSNSCRAVTGFALCIGMSAYEQCKNSTSHSSS